MPVLNSAIPEYFSHCSSLYLQVDPTRVPRHIAIIMDGNGRWARQKGLLRVRGHEHARASVREAARACGEIGVKALSLFAFSTENWKRPPGEVDFLLHFLKTTLEDEAKDLSDENVSLRVSGDLGALPDWLNLTLSNSVKALQANTGLILNLAINYGGKQDIVQAMNKMLEARSLKSEVEISEDEFEKYLYTSGLPDVDLLIRTSGELRISNFFLWQAAYAELYFTPLLWPDFRREHVLEAVLEYQKRQRRFGGL